MTEARTAASHGVAVGQALFVTFLWSTSWVLIKLGLEDLRLEPLSFAGLRYTFGAAVLLPLALPALRAARTRTGVRAAPDRRLVSRVAAYGLLFVGVAQGAQFAALAVLPATTVNLLLSSIPALVALMAIGGGGERPSVAQVAGIGLLVAGATVYFGPADLPAGAAIGFAAAAACVLASALSSHLGRALNRDAAAVMGGALGITAVSMGVGGVTLLLVGLALEGVPALDLRGWAVVGWLAVVNTALAFTLWNHTLRTLTAVESSVINNTMTVQIAVLAVVFLGERLGPAQVAGLVLASLGAAVVQVAPALVARRSRRLRVDAA